MCATTALISPQKVGSEERSVFLPDEGLVSGSKPELQRLLLAYVTRKSIGIAAANHRLKNGPDRIPVLGRSQANRQDGSAYLNPTSFSNSPSDKMGTPSSLARSYFDPGSVPTTT